MPQLLCFLGAVLLLGGVALLRGPSRRSVLDLGRDLVRPVVLPVLWRGLEVSGIEAGPEEQAARGRLLLQFLPQWTDGHIHFAWQLAFEASRGQNPEQALQRLLAALAYLKSALAVEPTRPVEIWEAMAYMVQIRCQKDPALAKAFRERMGKEPAKFTDDCLAGAQRIDPSQARAEQRVIVKVALIAGLLRTRNRQAALELLAATLRGLESFRDQQLAAEWRTALLDLRSCLEAGTSLQDLKKHPQLDEILYVLERL